MSRADHTAAEFVLTDGERAQLLRWPLGGGSLRLAVRARIVLACAEPRVVYERVAAELGEPPRVRPGRCEGLVDGRRSGRPKARELRGHQNVVRKNVISDSAGYSVKIASDDDEEYDKGGNVVDGNTLSGVTNRHNC